MFTEAVHPSMTSKFPSLFILLEPVLLTSHTHLKGFLTPSEWLGVIRGPSLTSSQQRYNQVTAITAISVKPWHYRGDKGNFQDPPEATEMHHSCKPQRCRRASQRSHTSTCFQHHKASNAWVGLFPWPLVTKKGSFWVTRLGEERIIA